MMWVNRASLAGDKKPSNLFPVGLGVPVKVASQVKMEAGPWEVEVESTKDLQELYGIFGSWGKKWWRPDKFSYPCIYTL
jgi:hypothetical protein